jgi:large subunit ribosomal protein L28
MSKRCELTGVGVQTGNNVSHSQRKTRRRFLPNLQTISLRSEALSQTFKLRITAATLRSVDHNGGLDGFLVGTANKGLTEEAIKIKRKVKNALATAA